ncbi:MAG: HEPN domain protein [Candidatus Bathyarchaeota archaeon BA2]|nr:MAG: HEPN domain protein [Candidatus Bathyarchaeota archaeon BA2]
MMREKAFLMLKRAKRWLSPAEVELKKGHFDNVIYLCQMCVETAAKAVFTALGIDYPKEHDVSMVFRQLSQRDDLPLWFRKNVFTISATIKSLAEIRGDAAYGYERGLSPVYFKGKALDSIKAVASILNDCEKLLREIFK